MKKFSCIFLFCLILVATSCQTRVVSASKPMQPNSLELYKKYTVQTNNATEYKVQVLRQDAENIVGKNNKGEEIVIKKADVREIKKVDVLSTVVLGVAAVAAVIFVPI